jgi:hypothetical protein
MTRQGQFQLSRGKIPYLTLAIRRVLSAYLNHSVARAGCEPLVSRIDRKGANPSHVTRDDPR